MKKTFLKRILPMFLLLTFIFSCFACDINNDKEKPHLTKEEVGIKSIDYTYNRYEEFEFLNAFIINEPNLQNQYFYVINTENVTHFYVYEGQGSPGYAFCYVKENDSYVEVKIHCYDDFIKDDNAPQKNKGCLNNPGTSHVTCKYRYHAYPTSETTTPITFKHCFIDDDRAILLYQEEKLIGAFIYLVGKPNDAYYEKFLKDHLMIIGVSA